eukprot:1178139-Prorocentrum_minimum.AAC.3
MAAALRMRPTPGLWGVECALAVIGAGGPVKRSNVINLCISFPRSIWRRSTNAPRSCSSARRAPSRGGLGGLPRPRARSVGTCPNTNNPSSRRHLPTAADYETPRDKTPQGTLSRELFYIIVYRARRAATELGERDAAKSWRRLTRREHYWGLWRCYGLGHVN